MSDKNLVSLEDKKNIVRDLTHLFNRLADIQEEAQNEIIRKHGPDVFKMTRAQFLGRTSSEFAVIFDFHAGSSEFNQVVHPNTLASAELSAIEMVQHICMRMKGDQTQHFELLCRVMSDVYGANGIPFNPSYPPKPK